MTTSNVINITELIDTRPLSKYQLYIFGLCAFAALIDGYDTLVIGITAPAIADSLHLDVTTFGPIFAAAQFGYLISAFAVGPIADRVGRKSILILSVAILGVFSLLTPYSNTYLQLIVLRFLTGLGLGGASTTFVSLSNEYAPLRVRSTVVTLTWTMLPVGNAGAEFLSSVLLPRYGWDSMYYLGGIVSIVIAALMLAHLPESASFLVLRGAGYNRLSGIVERIAPDLSQTTSTRYRIADGQSARMTVANLFTHNRALMTIGFWGVFFCYWPVLITVLTWMVPVLRAAGVPISVAPLVAVVSSVGAITGAPLIGRMMDKTNPYAVVIVSISIGAISVTMLGFAISSVTEFTIFAFIEGFALGGASGGLIALVSSAYPTAIRSTGIGWALCASRFGAVASPLLAGAILSSGGTAQYVFGSMGLLCVIAVVFLFILMRIPARR